MHHATKNTNSEGEKWILNNHSVIENPDKEVLFVEKLKTPYLGSRVVLSIGYNESTSKWMLGYSISLTNEGCSVGCCVGMFDSKAVAKKTGIEKIVCLLKKQYGQHKIANKILASTAQTSLF